MPTPVRPGAAFWRRLRQLFAPGQRRGNELDAAMLKDLGLSRADLPAIAAGSYASDNSRRPR